MSQTVGDLMLERLAREWRVRRVDGHPGDGIVGAFVRDSGLRPEFVQVRHEETAALMGCAHAKFTGEVGVCLATSGPARLESLTRR